MTESLHPGPTLSLAAVVLAVVAGCHVETRKYPTWRVVRDDDGPTRFELRRDGRSGRSCRAPGPSAAYEAWALGSGLAAAVATSLQPPGPQPYELRSGIARRGSRPRSCGVAPDLRLAIESDVRGFRLRRGVVVPAGGGEVRRLRPTVGYSTLELAVARSDATTGRVPYLAPFTLVAFEVESRVDPDIRFAGCRLLRPVELRTVGLEVEVARETAWSPVDAGCRIDTGVAVHAWVAGTGKERVAVAVRGANFGRTERRLAVDEATLSIAGGASGRGARRIGGQAIESRPSVAPGETVTVPVWFEFSSERSWNRRRNRGELRLTYRVEAGGTADAGTRRREETLELPVAQRRRGRYCRVPAAAEPDVVPATCALPRRDRFEELDDYIGEP